MFSSKRKKIEHFRSTWGKPLDKYRNLDLIGSYHTLLQKPGSDSTVDEKTWKDLDFDSIFAAMDRNTSGIGQQYLYRLLHTYEQDETILHHRHSLIERLSRERDLREQIQLQLSNVTGPSSYFIAYLILGKELPHTRFYPFFYLSSLLSAASLLLISVNGAFLFVAMGVLLLNIVLDRVFSKRIYQFFAGFSSLNALLHAALGICKIKIDQPIKEIEVLKSKRDVLTSLQKKLGYLVIDKQGLHEFLRITIEYLNMFFLFDLIAYYRSVDILLKSREEIRTMFDTCAALDASIAVASYLEELPWYSTPTFHDSPTIHFKDLYHPLIQNAVPNTIDALTTSALITGSNMSGKTTFIKTVGIGFVLSQSLYITLSREMTIPKLMVKSAIRRNESLEEGKSYFFVEIESLREFLRLSEKKRRYLFLIDEIFRGTNTIERLASSTAVLRYMEADNTVLVTTHDIELQNLLDGTFTMCHFSEQVENGNFFFDYKIRNGPCSSGNAIKLLEIMHYPTSVTTEAGAIARVLKDSPSVTDPDVIRRMISQRG